MRTVAALLILTASTALSAAPVDGSLDLSFGDTGRGVYGFMESATPQLRAMVKAPSGRIWMFADDPVDRAALFITRSLANGQPDLGFGQPLANGQRRLVFPNNLVPQVEMLDVRGALIQADGKPLIYGALRSADGETGAFPAMVCRLTVAGTLDPSFDGDGCKTFRSFLNGSEVCAATDIALSAVDQSIVAVGNCSANTLNQTPFITRILSTGATDTEFGAGAGLITPALPQATLSQHYESVVLGANGVITVLATLETAANNIIDLNLGVLQFDNGGSPDLTFASNGYRRINFDQGGDNHDRARDLLRKADGGLLVLGEAKKPDPERTVALLAQLLPNGNPDPAFGVAGKHVDELDKALNVNSTVNTLALDEYGRLLVSAQQAQGQLTGTVDVGREFLFAVPASIPPEGINRLIISAEAATTGTITSPSFAQTIPFTALPGVPAIVPLPLDLISLSFIDNGVINNLSLRVVANGPVSVVPQSGRTFALDSTLITPVAALGTHYRVMSWGTGIGAGSNMVIAASADQTVVRITPKVAAAGRPAGVPFTVMLARGQAYHLWVAGTQGDLTGSLVIANKPIAVISGHPCALVPDADNDFCDAAYEQQVPVSRWGTTFVAVPHPSRPSGERIRVLAHYPNTSVFENGVRLTTLMPGEHHTILRTTATVITTTQPASVAQFAQGCRADINPTCIGDPYQLTLEPISRWSTRVLLGMHDNGIANGAVPPLMTIVAPQATAASIRVNGAALPVGVFMPIANSAMVYAQLNRVANTSHLITADAPIYVSATGMNASEAHAHIGAVVRTGNGADTHASADDLLLRLRPNGSRDVGFGIRGVARIDHTAYFQSPDKSIDNPTRMIADGNGILVGSAVRNVTGEQDLLFSYRVISDGLFADDLED